LIELNLRLNQPAQAYAELENYLAYLQSGNRGTQGIKFIEELQQDRPDDLVLRRALAQQYQQAGRIEDAVAQLDSIADTFLNAGRKEEAIVTINQILLMNPPTANQYRQLLVQLQQ
jgi:thioredoxin-like negative regulator of GroEL